MREIREMVAHVILSRRRRISIMLLQEWCAHALGSLRIDCMSAYVFDFRVRDSSLRSE